MIARYAVPAFAVLAGLAIAVAVPSIPQTARSVVGLQPVTENEKRPAEPAAKTEGHEAGEEHAEEGKIAMTAEQVAAASIQLVTVGGGALTNHVAVPGVLAASQDRLARVTARVPGTVSEVRKKLGDTVVRGDVLAVIESREISDAKGEYLAATRTLALAETTLAREARLWKQRISAEQEFLQARSTAEEGRIRLDLSRQRLSTLGLSDAEVAGLPRQPTASLRRLEIRVHHARFVERGDGGREHLRPRDVARPHRGLARGRDLRASLLVALVIQEPLQIASAVHELERLEVAGAAPPLFEGVDLPDREVGGLAASNPRRELLLVGDEGAVPDHRGRGRLV
ncbi:MAG: biotin/lipoyl-binding protein, partial [Deltaproteobacteria bacterium]